MIRGALSLLVLLRAAGGNRHDSQVLLFARDSTRTSNSLSESSWLIAWLYWCAIRVCSVEVAAVWKRELSAAQKTSEASICFLMSSLLSVGDSMAHLLSCTQSATVACSCSVRAIGVRGCARLTIAAHCVGGCDRNHCRDATWSGRGGLDHVCGASASERGRSAGLRLAALRHGAGRSASSPRLSAHLQMDWRVQGNIPAMPQPGLAKNESLINE